MSGDSPKGCLPNALVVGAPKAGTTTLCAALNRHPGIWMYPRKETHFFNDHYEGRGIEWYRSLFAPAPPDAVVMEGTPDYAMSNHVDTTMARIAAHIPDARLIFMVRDPVDRIESHYVQALSNHRCLIPLPEALARWPEIIGSSDYPAILAAIYRHFPADRVLILFLDEYASDKATTHRRVLDFLGLPTPDAALLNALAAQGPMHRRADQGMDGSLLSRLRRFRHYDRINMALPRIVVRAGKRVLRRKLSIPSTLDPADRARLTDQLGPGWRAFQQQHRPPPIAPTTAPD